MTNMEMIELMLRHKKDVDDCIDAIRKLESILALNLQFNNLGLARSLEEALIAESAATNKSMALYLQLRNQLGIE